MEERDNESLDKLCLRIMFNRLPSRKSIALPTKSFLKRNNYPRWLVKQMMKTFLDEQTNRNAATATTI